MAILELLGIVGLLREQPVWEWSRRQHVATAAHGETRRHLVCSSSMTFEGRRQMSTVTTTRCRYVAEAVSPPALPAELVDGITDAILASSSRAGRAEVIARLVAEMYESVAWLGADADAEELLSLRRLVDEAGQHAARAMSADDLEAQDLNEKSRRAVEAGPLG